jgi:CcmD family protein
MPIALLQIELPASNLPYLFAAFAVSWAAFFVYAFFLTRRRQDVQGEIEGLRRALEHRETPDPG